MLAKEKQKKTPNTDYGGFQTPNGEKWGGASPASPRTGLRLSDTSYESRRTRTKSNRVEDGSTQSRTRWYDEYARIQGEWKANQTASYEFLRTHGALRTESHNPTESHKIGPRTNVYKFERIRAWRKAGPDELVRIRANPRDPTDRICKIPTSPQKNQAPDECVRRRMNPDWVGDGTRRLPPTSHKQNPSGSHKIGPQTSSDEVGRIQGGWRMRPSEFGRIRTNSGPVEDGTTRNPTRSYECARIQGGLKAGPNEAV